jgi:mRNA deadenylase 3'-5' endonuclease subunit Ccr4
MIRRFGLLTLERIRATTIAFTALFTIPLLCGPASKKKVLAGAQSSSLQRDTLKVIHFNVLAKSLGNNLNHWFLETHSDPRLSFEIPPEKFASKILEITSKKANNDTGWKYSFAEWSERCASSTGAPHCDDLDYGNYSRHPILASAILKTHSQFFEWSSREPRMKALLERMMRDEADVMSLVEVDMVDWLKPLLEGNGYSMIQVARPGTEGKAARDGTVIAYRRDRLELDEHSVCRIYYGSGGPRETGNVGIAARFKTSLGGTRFWVLSTHLYKNPTGAREEGYRVEEVSELLEGDCRFDGAAKILLGDLNALPGSKTIKALEAAGYRNALAIFAESSASGGIGAVPCTTATRARRDWIDHVFWKGEELVPIGTMEGFAFPSCGAGTRWPNAEIPSDHSPISTVFKIRPPADAGNLSHEKYVQACLKGLGIDALPPVRCDALYEPATYAWDESAGKTKEITLDSRPGTLPFQEGMDCLNGATAGSGKKRCMPGTRFGRLPSPSKDVEIVANCTPALPHDPVAGLAWEIGVIAYRRSNGATCFFFSNGERYKEAPSPQDPKALDVWLDPGELVRIPGGNCMECHSYYPWIRSSRVLTFQFERTFALRDFTKAELAALEANVPRNVMPGTATSPLRAVAREELEAASYPGAWTASRIPSERQSCAGVCHVIGAGHYHSRMSLQTINLCEDDARGRNCLKFDWEGFKKLAESGGGRTQANSLSPHKATYRVEPKLGADELSQIKEIAELCYVERTRVNCPVERVK